MNKVLGCFAEGAQLFFSVDETPNVTVVLSFWEDVDDILHTESIWTCIQFKILNKDVV